MTTVRNRGMGRGLAAILSVSEEAGEGAPELRELAVELVRPNPSQPRKRFDEEALQALGESVSERGVLQPVLVRPLAGGRYELVAGERRWRAAQLAGLTTIPALVQQHDDAQSLEVALVENMAREDLNPIEAARAVAGACRGTRAHARGGGTARRAQPRGGLEPAAPARPARRGSGPRRGRRADRGARSRAAARGRSCGPPAPGPCRRRERLVGAGGRATGARGERARAVRPAGTREGSPRSGGRRARIADALGGYLAPRCACAHEAAATRSSWPSTTSTRPWRWPVACGLGRSGKSLHCAARTGD